MKKTIEELLDNNKGWGRENYVDNADRVEELKNNLRTSKIITIYGEGGLGKTELVYQTLKESLVMKIKHFGTITSCRSKETARSLTSPRRISVPKPIEVGKLYRSSSRWSQNLHCMNQKTWNPKTLERNNPRCMV